jgi:hypothetical protein
MIRPHDVGHDRPDGVLLIVNGACWRGQIVDSIDIEVERARHVVLDELEPRRVHERSDVSSGPTGQIIDDSDGMSFVE